MPQIIGTALFERLARHREWLQFRDNFRVLSGAEVRLLPGDGEARPLSVAVDVHGITVGWLGVPLEESGGSALCGAKSAACKHILNLAAERFSSVLSAGIANNHEELPASVVRTCDWIRGHALSSEVRLTDAARLHGVSPSHLSRLFHASTGMTFQAYVTRVRLEHASKLLSSTNQSVTDIAFQSGFQSISQFNRSFRAVFGCTPRAHRAAAMVAAAQLN